MTGVRLAFKCGVWKPSAAEWILAMSSIQPEERLRIRRFVFRKHTRSALVSYQRKETFFSLHLFFLISTRQTVEATYED